MMSTSNIDYEIATDKFYEVLFEKIPAAEKMFKDTSQQKTMFVRALQSIEHWETGGAQVLYYLEVLGKKHQNVGLTSEHMEIGRDAFMQAIEAGTKNASEDVKQGLMKAFTAFEKIMTAKISKAPFPAQ